MRQRLCDICFKELDFDNSDHILSYETSMKNEYRVDLCDYHSTILNGLLRTWIQHEKEANSK